MRTVAEEVAELRALGVPDLVARYHEDFGKLPRSKHRAWLIKRLAWRLQERRLGGLSEVARRRLEELISEIDLPLDAPPATATGTLRKPGEAGDPTLGTSLVRSWRGREVRATVVDGGFECDGVVYGSLTAVAQAVTGAHWNGRLFFRLTARKATA